MVQLHEQYLGLAAQMMSFSHWIFSKFEKNSENSANLGCEDEETAERLRKVK